MTWPFALLAGLTAGSAIAAMTLRNLVHCALCLALMFAGLAGLFLQLNAEFVGLVQILVYVGAVAILIVFAILLTRGAEPPSPAPIATAAPWGAAIAVAAFVTMAGAVLRSPGVALHSATITVRADAIRTVGALPPVAPTVSVKALGERLMGDFVVPLEVLALLLTVAMIGAVIIAMQEKKPSQ
jgi:NADH-quinone oxidoreductase subunit J